jgi:hypothetical protein
VGDWDAGLVPGGRVEDMDGVKLSGAARRAPCSDPTSASTIQTPSVTASRSSGRCTYWTSASQHASSIRTRTRPRRSLRPSATVVILSTCPYPASVLKSHLARTLCSMHMQMHPTPWDGEPPATPMGQIADYRPCPSTSFLGSLTR